MPQPEIDPIIFTKDHAMQFEAELRDTSNEFTNSRETIETLLLRNSPEANNAALQDVLDTNEDVRAMVEMLGDFGRVMAVEIANMMDPEDEKKMTKAQETRATAEQYLIGYVKGYQTYMLQNMDGLFDPDEATEMSWGVAWRKVRDVLRPVGGAVLAYVVEYFDDLTRLAYPNDYEASSALRGERVASNPATRTFYEEMAPHLGRAILNRDDHWS